MHDLVRRWRRHVDAGAVVGHQEKLGGATFFTDFQRHDVARQLHLLAIKGLDHRRVRHLLVGGRSRLGGQGVA
ncbi:hypothetical protein D3C76_1370970 [compost metagenome]